MGSYANAFLDPNGNVIPQATITVFDAGGTVLSSIYTDSGLTTPKANPFTSNADGTFQFFAATGEYKLRMEKTGYTTFEVDYVPIGIGVPSSRLINTNSPLTGGGSLAGDLTLDLDESAVDHGLLGGLSDDDHTNYVHLTVVRTIVAVHQFNPAAPGAPFTLGANALSQLVTGLNADLIDGIEGAEIIQRDGSVAFTGKVSGIDPTSAAHLATKNYVDSLGGTVDVRRCKLDDSSDQTLSSGSPTAINWDTEIYDSNNFHDTVTNNTRITIPLGAAGKYMFFGGLVFDTDATGARKIGIRKNGTTFIGSDRVDAAGANETHLTTVGIDLASVGDYYELIALQESGSPVDAKTTADESYFAIEGGLTD